MKATELRDILTEVIEKCGDIEVRRYVPGIFCAESTSIDGIQLKRDAVQVSADGWTDLEPKPPYVVLT